MLEADQADQVDQVNRACPLTSDMPPCPLLIKCLSTRPLYKAEYFSQCPICGERRASFANGGAFDTEGTWHPEPMVLLPKSLPCYARIDACWWTPNPCSGKCHGKLQERQKIEESIGYLTKFNLGYNP